MSKCGKLDSSLWRVSIDGIIFLFVLGTSNGIKFRRIEGTDLGSLTGSSKISRNKNIDTSLDWISGRRNFTWQAWWLPQLSVTGTIIWEYTEIFRYSCLLKSIYIRVEFLNTGSLIGSSKIYRGNKLVALTDRNSKNIELHMNILMVSLLEYNWDEILEMYWYMQLELHLDPLKDVKIATLIVVSM